VFTGIVQGLRPVVDVIGEQNLRRLVVDLGELARDVTPGASVAINGVCLTVTSVSNGAACFDVIEESLTHTNLGSLAVGERVNVERSLRFGDEVGGHIVSGHVAEAGRVVDVAERPNVRDVTIEVSSGLLRYLHYKGFVAVDGVSLTIARVEPAHHAFGVSLIPETIERTTLGRLRVGDLVNVEIDAQTQAIVDTVERVLANRDAGATSRNG
jgi:riboflavin synthase